MRWVTAVLGVTLALTLTGCGGAGSSSPTSDRTVTTTLHGTRPAGVGSPTPIPAGPTHAAAGTCPLARSAQVADAVGMRLERETVLTAKGHVRGCRFYALQNSPLAKSEHLPGPNQPAVEIITIRYRSTTDAHNAMVLRAGASAEPEQIGNGPTGLCFQIAFNPPDHGKDWACAFYRASLLVLVKTVVTTPALNAVSVATEVASRL